MYCLIGNLSSAQPKLLPYTTEDIVYINFISSQNDEDTITVEYPDGQICTFSAGDYTKFTISQGLVPKGTKISSSFNKPSMACTIQYFSIVKVEGFN